MNYYYFDNESEMMLINNFQSWKKNDRGEGDALWRTGIAYITTGDKKYYNGIKRAFRCYEHKNVKKYQACRCNPNIGEEDVSRDQIILAWSSLYINGDDKLLKELVYSTPYKLSKRYLMTPTMWFWSRGLTGNLLFGKISSFLLMIELFFGVLYNKLIKFLVGYTQHHPEDLELMMCEPSLTQPWREKGEDLRNDFLNKKWKVFLWKYNFPGYGLHLSAWINYTSNNNIFKTINNYLIMEDSSKYNLLLKLLSGCNVIESEIDQYKPKEEWVWSTRFDKASRNRLLPEKYLNQLDKDILKTIKKRNKNL